MKNKDTIIKISALTLMLLCSSSQIKTDGGVSIGSEEHSLNIGAGRRVKDDDSISIGSKEHSLNIGAGERKYYNNHRSHRHHGDGSTFRERHPKRHS